MALRQLSTNEVFVDTFKRCRFSVFGLVLVFGLLIFWVGVPLLQSHESVTVFDITMPGWLFVTISAVVVGGMWPLLFLVLTPWLDRRELVECGTCANVRRAALVEIEAQKRCSECHHEL